MSRHIRRMLAVAMLLALALVPMPALAGPVDGTWVADDEAGVTIQADGIASTGWEALDTIEWRISKGVLTIRPLGGAEECSIATDWPENEESPWAFDETIKSVRFEGAVHWSGTLSSMFPYCTSLKSVDFTGLDTSSVTAMDEMFSDCSSLASIDLSGLDTSSVTDMTSMFSGCESLVSINLSGLDTSLVTDMGGMFEYCNSLKSLDLSALNTSSVLHMDRMIAECTSLTSINLAGLNMSSVQSMEGMFSGCSSLASLDLSGLNISSVTDMTMMFDGCTSLASFTVPATWPVHMNGALPEPTAENGKWWSLGAEEWFTVDAIANDRAGIADTYTNSGVLLQISEATVAKIPAQTYTGQKLTPKVSITYGDTALVEGTDYSVSYANNVNAGTAKVTVTGKRDFEGTLKTTFAIGKAAQPMSAKAKQATLKVSYNPSKAQTIDNNVKVTDAKGSVTYSNASTDNIAKGFSVNKKTGALGVPKATETGTYAVKIKVKAAGDSNHNAGSKTVTFKVEVEKAANTMTVTSANGIVLAKTLKKKSVTIAPLKVSNAQGKVTYAKSSGSGQLTINTKNGKVTVKKGTGVGTYTIKVKVTANGNTHYNKGSKTVTCKVVVK